MASDGAANDHFGCSCSISGDGNTCVIGAGGEDTKGADAGAVYVFVKSGSTWSQQSKIWSSDIQAGDGFGGSLSISRNGYFCLVGANSEDTTGTDAGSFYVFDAS
jgi:hypothetical protein